MLGFGHFFGNLGVGRTATTKFDVLGAANITGSTSLGSNLTVQTNTDIGSNLTVLGNVNKINGLGLIDNDIDNGRNLRITGISTFNSEVTIKGNLDPIESDTFRIRSNDIILGYSTTSNPSSNFTGNITSGSALVTNIDNTVDLIAHKPIELVSASGDLTIDSSAKIVSVASSTLIMSHAVTGTGSGTATFRLGGAGTEIAENGGIIIRGDTDKTILYKTSGINATNGVFHLSHGIQLNTGQLHIVDDTDGSITIGSTTVITKDKVHDKTWTNLIDNSNDNSA